MNNISCQDLIKILDLKPHPEGGYYKEIYRASELVKKQALPERFSGDRNFSTLIYFLLPKGKKSNFHRIKSDETWHFYLGGPITIVEINKEGKLKKTLLGQDIKNGQVLQYTVPMNTWFGAYPKENTEFSLVGCTVSPAFDFNDFELAKRKKLIAKFPQHKEIIEELTNE